MIFITFTSCLRGEKEDEFVLWETVYRLEIPAFSFSFDNAVKIKRVNVIYIIKSAKLLDENDVFFEKTDSLYKLVNRVRIYTDTIEPEYFNKHKYCFYEFYSNIYLDINYNPNDWKKYYHAIKDSIKNTELVYKHDGVYRTLKKDKEYKEEFVTETDLKIPGGTHWYDVDGW